MKILVLCNHGNVRSVGMKYLLQMLTEHDILNAGVEENTFETLQMLMNWADKIISLTDSANVAASLAPEKNIFIDVGPDLWNDPFRQELQHKLLKAYRKLDLINYL